MGSRLSVRDPVHGFIRADELETRLIATRPVQRLRSIRQLGVTNLVFPGAEHSRFSHTLGAMHLAGRVYDAIALAGGADLDPDPRTPERRVARAAALLHDIGHAPFSHTAEDLFDQPIDHEEMSRRLIELSEISGPLREHGLAPERVLRLLAGEATGVERLLQQIVSGELDVDKMDYLLRDSLFCGVQYGRFDLERLLDTLLPLRDPQTGEWGIGIDIGGVHAVEALVLARYYMFTQVYFNVTGKVLELHLNAWLNDEGVRWSAETERFLKQDDVSVLEHMRRSRNLHAAALLQREHFVLAAETREHASSEEREHLEGRLAQLFDRFDRSELLVSRSAKDPHRLGRSRVQVRHQDGELEPMEDASHFIRHLTRIDRTRVYCRPELRAEVMSLL
jgi:hypothetical protein